MLITLHSTLGLLKDKEVFESLQTNNLLLTNILSYQQLLKKLLKLRLSMKWNLPFRLRMLSYTYSTGSSSEDMQEEP